ncbi:phage baseplate assembly protein [Gilliamella sp. Fer4-1]|uniref:phage baseplate assembly protein n=1 Tax=Gilliamella sp. Fer4-1 TaxID=3120242 RepID=UPI00080E38E4|nr:contractile injection system protein, VgrG/Pvc8 family [Gilliamella apicola]OCG62245.1 hypothetical protein A9G30_09425 [Gilliamella apicola]
MDRPIVELYVGQLIYSGWTDVRITRSIEDMSGSFNLQLTSKTDVNDGDIKAGAECYVEINSNRVITGYIDDVVIDISDTEHTITVVGRDKTADLIDCAAIHASGRWRNASLQKIAEDLCKPFGIGVIWDVNDSKASEPFRWMQIEPSETVFEILARAARQRGILMTSDVYGNLVFTGAGEKNIAILTLGDNIKNLNITRSWRDRFSLYRVLGDSAGGAIWGETQTAVQSTAVYANVADESITRYRPTIIMSDDNINKKNAAVRGDWERRRAAAHSQPVSVTVQGWLYDDINLWLPNHQVFLTAEIYDLFAEELLIVEAEFGIGNDDGITTTLLLMPRDGFLAPAEPEKRGGNSTIWR